METTTHLQLPLLSAEQGSKHITHNEALSRLDALVQLSVSDADLTAPPPSPAEGERHLVASGAADVWAGQDGAIAAWLNGVWTFLAPQTGWLCWVVADEEVRVFDGTDWQIWSPQSQQVAQLGVNATADSENLLAVHSNAVLLSYNDGGSGTGNIQISANRQNASTKATLMFQTGYVGQAEIGLVGSGDLTFKSSSDGTTFTEAMRIGASDARLYLTNGLGGNYASYTPTITAASGTFGSLTALGAYYDLGPLRFVDLNISIADVGTAAGTLYASLPSAPSSGFNNGVGREMAVVGFMLAVFGFANDSRVSLLRFSDLGFPGGDGYVLNAQFQYRTR